MVKQKNLDHILSHSEKDSKIHEAEPKKIWYEKDQAPDMKGESIAFRRELEEVNFQDLEDQGKEVTVSIEPGKFVAWKIVDDFEGQDRVESKMIPWSQVLDIDFIFPTWEERDQ